MNKELHREDEESWLEEKHDLEADKRIIENSRDSWKHIAAHNIDTLAMERCDTLKLLRRLEWHDDGSGLLVCPCCGKGKGTGHFKNCELDAAIRKLEASEPNSGDKRPNPVVEDVVSGLQKVADENTDKLGSPSRGWACRQAIQLLRKGEKTLYYELLHAVESKHDNETRHETALRYIKEKEQGGDFTVAADNKQF